jgi:hypothetical protein
MIKRRNAMRSCASLGEGAAVDRHRSGVSGSSNLSGGAGRPACDAFFLSERRKPITLAARYAIPAVYFFRECVMEGDLMSYSPSLVQAYRQVGIYAGRINLNTAKTLGLTFPPGELAIADEMIE